MNLLIATTNPGKIKEIHHELQLASLDQLFTLKSLADFPSLPDCIEDRPTFVGNASKKARHFASLTHTLTLADDSGLAVDALDGRPGVLSARYANTSGDRHTIDTANNAKLLADLDHVPDENRQARFVCAIALASPTPTTPLDLAVFIDDVRGTLLRSPRGTNGFGYDPYFLLPQFQKTTAELTIHEKSQISHRGKSLRRLLAWLKQNHPQLPTPLQQSR